MARTLRQLLPAGGRVDLRLHSLHECRDSAANMAGRQAKSLRGIRPAAGFQPAARALDIRLCRSIHGGLVILWFLIYKFVFPGPQSRDAGPHRLPRETHWLPMTDRAILLRPPTLPPSPQPLPPLPPFPFWACSPVARLAVTQFRTPRPTCPRSETRARCALPPGCPRDRPRFPWEE